jgi:lysophospholipase L1-like esterase
MIPWISAHFQRRLAARAALSALVASVTFGCSSDPGTDTGGAGSHSEGGATAGTPSTSGASSVSGASSIGGAPAGGAPAGGAPSIGGAPAGGAQSGGAPAGGAQSGGGAPGSAGAAHGGGGAAGASGGPTAGSAGAAGESGNYNPCPTNGDACKILPLGDSITWGIQYDGAYRVELFSKAVAAGQKITFTGSLSNGPSMVSNVAFPKSNEGHSGWTIDQDAGLVPSPAFTTIPHIVLLMIGTNDIYASSGQAEMPTRLGKLLDKIFSAAPNALLVVAKITPLSNASWNATIKTYNDAIPALLQTKVAAGKHVIGVDMNTGFTSGMLSSDGVHPNKSGYDFMGDLWYTAISKYLPK